MRRRVFLAGVLSGGIGLAGCLGSRSSGDTSGPPSATQSTASRTTDPTGRATATDERCEPTRTTAAPRADLVVENRANASRTVSVEVRNATDPGSTVFERTYTVDSGDEISASTGLFTRREGAYEVRAALDSGASTTRTVEVHPTSTTGSIVFVEVSGENVSVRRVYVDFTPTPAGPGC